MQFEKKMGKDCDPTPYSKPQRKKAMYLLWRLATLTI